MEEYSILQLEDEYDEYATECECALRTVMARLTNLQVEMERSSERSPFDTIDHRIKTFDSAVEKCRRRGLPLTIESLRSLHDVAGIRIITPFRDDIYTVAEALGHQPSMTIVERKDYVEKPKENGYSSLHLSVLMELYFMNSSKAIPVEIQIRDKAMDLWATLEHIVKYKNPTPGPEAERQFKQIAEVLNQFDLSAMHLRDYSAEEIITNKTEGTYNNDARDPVIRAVGSKVAIPMPGPSSTTESEPKYGLTPEEIAKIADDIDQTHNYL